MAYLRAQTLRENRQPADPVALRLFQDLQTAEHGKNRSCTPRQKADYQQREREAWKHLIRYLTTLERPEQML
jgi:hypothetical protein